VFATTDESWTFVSVITGFFIFEQVTLIYFDLKYRTFSTELHMDHFFHLMDILLLHIMVEADRDFYNTKK